MNDEGIIVVTDARIGRYNPETGDYEEVQPIPTVDTVNLISGDGLAVLHRDSLISKAELPDVYYTDAVGNVKITVTIPTARWRGRNIDPQFYRTMALMGLWRPLIERSIQRKKHRKALRRKRR